MLSRKYYRMIARVIDNRTLVDNENRLNKEDLINDLCLEFKLDNTLFNEYKFIDACKETSFKKGE